MTSHRHRVAAAVLVGILSAGCSDPPPSTSPEADQGGIGHIHGLANNPADGRIYAAAHTGIFRLEPGGPVRVPGRVQDTMGFLVIGPDRFLGSGHPGPTESTATDMGLISSDNGGTSWEPVSLDGRADFHALSTGDGSIYGWDSASHTVLRSDDFGITWTQGATVPDVGALAVDPENGNRILATTPMGLLESVDGGTHFARSPVQPAQPLVLIDIAPRTGGGGSTTVAGVGGDGTAWTLRDAVWSGGTSPAGPPQAFAVLGPDRYVVATDQAVSSTEDAGRTWTDIAATR